MKIAYVRVSSVDQNEARQVEALEKFGIEKWFKEKVSAKDTNRPQLQAMLEFAREGIAIARRKGVYKGRKAIKVDNKV